MKDVWGDNLHYMYVYKLIVNSEMQEVKLRDQLPHDLRTFLWKKHVQKTVLLPHSYHTHPLAATLLTVKESPSEWFVLWWRLRAQNFRLWSHDCLWALHVNKQSHQAIPWQWTLLTLQLGVNFYLSPIDKMSRSRSSIWVGWTVLCSENDNKHHKMSKRKVMNEDCFRNTSSVCVCVWSCLVFSVVLDI